MFKNNHKKLFSLLSIIGLLTACGGGGGGGSGTADVVNITQIAINADTAYTGSRNPALLDESNTMKFMQLIVGTQAADDDLNFQYRQQANENRNDSNFLKIQQDFKKTAELTTGFRNNSLANRVLSETISCPLGGQAIIRGDSNKPDEATVTYQQCQSTDSVIRNGKSSLVVSEYSASDPDTPQDFVITFEGLSVSFGGVESMYTGTYQYETDIGTYSSSSSSVLANVHIKNLNTNEQIYLSNLLTRRDDSGGNSNSTYEDSSAVSGHIYFGNHGYVQVSSSDNLVLRDTLTPIEKGFILLKGASNSKARARALYSGSDGDFDLELGDHRVDLDKDGDGIFELSLTHDNSSTVPQSSDFQSSTETLPIANIANADSLLAEFFYKDQSILLDASGSHIPSNDRIYYQWTIEEKPAGSTSELSAPNNLQSYYSLDVRGQYKISLKVTDSVGNSDITFIDLNSANRAPSIAFQVTGYAYLSDLVPLGNDIFVFSEVSDLDDFDPDRSALADGVTLTWSFNIPPESSLDLSQYVEDHSIVGSSIVDFTPDVEGQYDLTLTATDSEGLQTQKLISVIVAEKIPPNAAIYVFGSTTEPVIGTQRKLSAFSSIVYGDANPEMTTFSWSLTSAPEDSTAALVYDSDDHEDIEFTPDQLGYYEISLTVTDEYGLIGTDTFSFTVLE